MKLKVGRKDPTRPTGDNQGGKSNLGEEMGKRDPFTKREGKEGVQG